MLIRRSAPSQSETSSPLATASPPIALISSTTSCAGPRRAPDAVHLAAEVVDHDLGAVLGQHQRVLAADAASGSGHDADPSSHIPATASVSLVRVDFRHRRLPDRPHLVDGAAPGASRRAIVGHGPAHRDARQWRRALLIGVPAVVVLVLLTVWGVDAHGSSGRVARNVSLAGKGVGGDSRAELDAEVDKQADATKARAVHIVTPMASYDSTADAMGLALDQPTTTDAVLRVGHTENMVTRPLRWIAALFSTRTVTPSFTVNRAVAAQTARTLEGTAHVDPIEPSLTASPAGTVTIVAGKPGTGIDVDRLAGPLVHGAPDGPVDRPLEVHVDQGALPPRFTDAQAQQIADQANALAHRPLTLTIGAQTKPLEPALLASWFPRGAERGRRQSRPGHRRGRHDPCARGGLR